MSDISHGENWAERVLGLSFQRACLRLEGAGRGKGALFIGVVTPHNPLSILTAVTLCVALTIR